LSYWGELILLISMLPFENASATIMPTRKREERLTAVATSTLSKVKQNKADEFYAQLPDIEAEMR
jgi:hypothetical protein